ncbi:MAG: dihydroorotase [Deltaproteobacteria bacterium]|nr:dihydroorotase [Deltaproteobacteria bacterium]
MKPLLIKGGRIIDCDQNLDLRGDLFVRGGKIEAIATSIPIPQESPCTIIDAEGLIVTPGWLDIHTHLREPGANHKETIKSGSEAAAAGGFTTIACMPNTQPVNDNSFITNYIYQKVSSDSDVNIYCIGAISKGLQGEQLAEIGSMWEAGIVGISDDGNTVMNSYLMRKAMDYSKRFDLVVITHCEDSNLKGKGVMNEGFNSARFGLRGIPNAAEELMVARDILLSELTGAKLHIAHVSTQGSVELIRQAKKRGARVSAEVTPHHLTLTDEAVGNYDTNTKVAPPLREIQDLEALWEGLADGTIDALASDHAPHSVEEKEVEYDLAAFGMVGLETAFPLYFRLVLENKISLSRLVSALTVKPAEIIGIPRGTLKVGSQADITVFDPKSRYRLDKSKFRSRSTNTPFHGVEVQGKVCYTVCGGKVVHRSEHLSNSPIKELK